MSFTGRDFVNKLLKLHRLSLESQAVQASTISSEENLTEDLTEFSV